MAFVEDLSRRRVSAHGRLNMIIELLNTHIVCLAIRITEPVQLPGFGSCVWTTFIRERSLGASVFLACWSSVRDCVSASIGQGRLLPAC